MENMTPVTSAPSAPVAPAAPVAPVTTTPASPVAPVAPITPGGEQTSSQPVPAGDQFLTKSQRIQNLVNSTLAGAGAPVASPVITPTTPITVPAAPTAPVEQPTTTTPSQPVVATPQPTTDFDLENFSLDLDSDPTEQPSQQQQPVTPVQATSTDPAPEPVTATSFEDPIPDTFSEAERAIIERYRNMPGSQKIRTEAKFARALAKSVDKGGLGYIPDPGDVITNFRLADGMRAMVNDYSSGDPRAITNWAQNWMFQLGQRPDGTVAPQFDPQTNTPMLREGAQSAITALVHNAVQHPETAQATLSAFNHAMKIAAQNNLPWAANIQQAALRESVSGIVSELESNLATAKSQTVTFRAGDTDVQVPMDQVIGRVVNIFKSLAGIDQQQQQSNPELEQLRNEINQLKNQGKQSQKQNSERAYTEAVTNTQNKILQTITKDVKFALQPMIDALSQSEAGRFEVEQHQRALVSSLVNQLKANPGFLKRYNQFRADVRNGIPVEQTQAGLLKAARQSYFETLSVSRANLLRSRLGSIGQATNTTQPVPTAQPVAQTQAAITQANVIAGGRPTMQTVAPGTANGSPSAEARILPGESRFDAIRRLTAAKLGTGQL